MQYAGMAFQMVILMAIGAFLGKKLDGHFVTDRPYFTAVFVIFFLFIAFYLIFKDLVKVKKNQ